MRNLRWVIGAFLFIFPACSREDASVSDNDRCPEVTVLFSRSGLGDQAYNDNIAYGVYCSREEHGFMLRTIVPSGMDEAGQLVDEWLNATSDVPRLLLLASSDYYDLLCDKEINMRSDMRSDIILFDCHSTVSGCYSVCIPRYGAAYWAGMVTADKGRDILQPIIVCANDKDDMVRDLLSGFSDGYSHTTGVRPDTMFLSADEGGGYDCADVAYQKCHELAQKYNFIFPVAGGSEQGFLRYTREYGRGLYMACMDVDNSDKSNSVMYSVCLYADRAVQTVISQWIENNIPAQHQTFGLASGVIECVPSSNYTDFWGDSFRLYYDTALNKEREYEE